MNGPLMAFKSIFELTRVYEAGLLGKTNEYIIKNGQVDKDIEINKIENEQVNETIIIENKQVKSRKNKMRKRNRTRRARKRLQNT